MPTLYSWPINADERRTVRSLTQNRGRTQDFTVKGVRRDGPGAFQNGDLGSGSPPVGSRVLLVGTEMKQNVKLMYNS